MVWLDTTCIRSSPDPSLSCGSGSGLRDKYETVTANQNVLSAIALVEIPWNVHISRKVFQVHYLQYQTYSIQVEHNLYIYHYHIGAHIVAVCKQSLMGARL